MTPLPVLAPRISGNPQPASERPCPREHTEAEWEAKKALIKKLYIGDNRKLSETMAILESKHAFAATEQMYKKRLRKWNIRKRAYRKGQAATAISTPASTPDPDSHDDVDVEKVPRVPNPQDAPVSLVQVSALEPYAGLETVLRSVFSWSQGKLESHRIPSDPMSRYLASPNQPPIQDSRTMYRTFELVFDLWERERGDLAGMAARKGFYVLEYALTDDHPDLIWHILDTIYDMVSRGHLQLLAMFLDHAFVLSQRQLPSQHPLLRILQQLRRCDYQSGQGRQHVCRLLRLAWLRNVDVLGDQVGSLSRQHLWLYEQLIWDGRSRLRKDSDLKRRREAMTAALQALAASQGSKADPDSEKLRIQALILEFTQMDLGDKENAEKLALGLLNQTEDSGVKTRSNARFHAYARKMLARINEERCDWAVAEQNLRWAISKREAAHGASNNLRVVRDMWVLASHFQRVGKQAEADQVAQDAINRSTQYLDDIPG